MGQFSVLSLIIYHNMDVYITYATTSILSRIVIKLLIALLLTDKLIRMQLLCNIKKI